MAVSDVSPTPSWPPSLRIGLVIPALNEEQALPKVLDELPGRWFARIVVVDNGSTDATAEVARAAGADVVTEPRRGYGAACLRGLAALADDVDIVVFMDADGSDVAAEAAELIEPIAQGEADLVIGSRERGRAVAGSLRPVQRHGNQLAVTLIRLLYGHRYTDLGPFRAIGWSSLQRLNMRDTNFGWTVEMQVKALKRGLRVQEVPVSYRVRIGQSKISGTLGGSLRAGVKILWTIARLRVAG
jgi:glycosyltransferase involved in cell wall biosynthesis